MHSLVTVTLNYGAGGIVIIFDDGNWNAATLPVAIVNVLCAGNLFFEKNKSRISC